jgi:hypothetical protein
MAIYIVSDERDVVRLRTDYRERTVLYRFTPGVWSATSFATTSAINHLKGARVATLHAQLHHRHPGHVVPPAVTRRAELKPSSTAI